MAKVSVIIPVYGVERFIEKCAYTLFEQSLDDVEYLFINDCTLDRSIEIVKEVLQKYPHRQEQVVIHKMPQNSGQSAVRRWGMENATGDYVIHCDSDDWMDLDMLNKLWNKANIDDLDVVVCDYYYAYDYKLVYNKGCRLSNCYNFFYEVLERKSQWSLWNKLFRRSLYKDTNFVYPCSNMGEDMVLTLQLLYRCKRIGYIDRPLYFYRCDNSFSITSKCDEEGILDNFGQRNRNINLLCSILAETVDKNKIEKAIINVKLMGKNYLLPIIDKPHIFDLWKSTFDEINSQVVFCSKVSVISRIKFVLVYVGLYPFFMRLRKLC